MPDRVTAGYSGTPLVRKIGIKPNHRVALYEAPENWDDLLGPIPGEAVYVDAEEAEVDVAIVFVTDLDDLERVFPRFQARLADKGMLWVAWPKKAAKVPTNLAFASVQAIGLACGLVDVKVCAIDETWTGLKFLRRRVQK